MNAPVSGAAAARDLLRVGEDHTVGKFAEPHLPQPVLTYRPIERRDGIAGLVIWPCFEEGRRGEPFDQRAGHPRDLPRDDIAVGHMAGAQLDRDAIDIDRAALAPDLRARLEDLDRSEAELREVPREAEPARARPDDPDAEVRSIAQVWGTDSAVVGSIMVATGEM